MHSFSLVHLHQEPFPTLYSFHTFPPLDWPTKTHGREKLRTTRKRITLRGTWWLFPSCTRLGGCIRSCWIGVFLILLKTKDYRGKQGTLGYALRYKTAGGTLGDTLIRLKLYQLNRIPNFFCTKSLACHLKIPNEKIIFIGATTPTVAFFCSSN